MGSNLRRLIILRHAQAEPASRGGSDHERPLTEQGRRDAPAVGAQLAARGWTPQVVISSDARRTRETWEAMRGAVGGAPEVRGTASLYLKGLDAIRSAVSGLPPAITCAMVVGHNPGWEDAVYGLCQVSVRMTPCNAALLELSAQAWGEAMASDAWQLDTMLRP